MTPPLRTGVAAPVTVSAWQHAWQAAFYFACLVSERGSCELNSWKLVQWAKPPSASPASYDASWCTCVPCERIEPRLWRQSRGLPSRPHPHTSWEDRTAGGRGGLLPHRERPGDRRQLLEAPQQWRDELAQRNGLSGGGAGRQLGGDLQHRRAQGPCEGGKCIVKIDNFFFSFN